jgi:hypothetical protein
MTIKEAILKSLEDFRQGATARMVYQNILDKGIFAFNKDAKTPENTISAQLGMMIKNKDSRISRYKNNNNVYSYYLTQYTEDIKTMISQGAAKPADEEIQPGKGPAKSKGSGKKTASTYHERDLHRLLCTYVRSKDILARTIYHEKSSKEEHQKWLHPDIVGVQFITFKDPACTTLFKSTGKEKTMRLFSYEMKKEIRTDYDLKKCFFQAVSNSSWANYGYLVAFYIDPSLRDELERLNHSFGIGFILLKANPYESEVWFPAIEKDLDFTTIDRLCEINPDFKDFILEVEATVSADEKYFEASKQTLSNSCDKIFADETEIKDYCLQHHIPYSEDSTL